MDLATLIATLDAHAQVLQVVEQEDHGDYLFYQITYVVDADLEIAEQMSICVLVQDRDGPSEAAYYKKGIPPFLKASSAFQIEVEIAVQNYQATHPDLEFYKIVSVHDEAQIAFLTGYMYNATTDESELGNYILMKENGSWKFRLIKSVL